MVNGRPEAFELPYWVNTEVEQAYEDMVSSVLSTGHGSINLCGISLGVDFR